MDKHRNIPNLRFPAFNGEWGKQKLGDIITRVAKAVEVETTELYQQIGIRSHGKGIFYKEAIRGKELGNKRVFWIVEDALIVNIVFAWEHAVSKTTSNEIGMIASHRFPMYFPKDSKSNVDYLLHFFLTPKGKTLLELASPGGAGRNKTLGQAEFLKLSFKIPSVLEQQKIASFFTTIDQKISQLKQKKTLLEQYKNGVMQKIFSQEIRFRDENGQEFPKWQEKRLEEIAQVYQPKTISQNELTKVGYYVYGANGIIGRYSDYNHKNEQIAITCRGNTCGTVNWTEPFSWITGNAMVINLDDNKTILKRFLYYCLSSSNLKYLITGSGQPQITGDIKKHNIFFPEVEEQTKIAVVLSAIDDKINHTQTQIEKAQLWKKGLIQKMFV